MQAEPRLLASRANEGQVSFLSSGPLREFACDSCSKTRRALEMQSGHQSSNVDIIIFVTAAKHLIQQSP
jgi:hypothetical protein